jgi:hypothetical protein
MHNIGKFYNFINKKLSCRSGVEALLSKDGVGLLVSDNMAKADILNDFFASSCTDDNDVTPTVPRAACLDTVTFTPGIILKAIQKIKSNTSCGPDGFPQSFLRNFPTVWQIPCH